MEKKSGLFQGQMASVLENNILCTGNTNQSVPLMWSLKQDLVLVHGVHMHFFIYIVAINKFTFVQIVPKYYITWIGKCGNFVYSIYFTLRTENMTFHIIKY